MTSEAPCYDAVTTPSPLLHEQLASMRLGSQEKLEVLHDSDSDNGVPINRMASQGNTISKSALEQENQALQLQIQNLQAKVREIPRLRGLRNQYRQEAHQLRREVVGLRAQLHQQKSDILIDSDHEEHTQRQLSGRRQSDVLHLDSHSFNGTIDPLPSFAKAVSQAELTRPSPQSIYSSSRTGLIEQQPRLKHSDVDYSEGDRNKWEQWNRLRVVDSRHQTLNQTPSSRSYSGPSSLTKEEKERLDRIRGCYRCHQPGHRASDKNAPCKHTSWMLEDAEH